MIKPNSNAAPAMLNLTPHILVVDDDTVICEQLQRLYALNHYKVTTAHHGEEALEILENEDIDLVIADIRLPGISGVELSQRIAETWSDVPVIVMTGFAEIDHAVRVLKLGVSDFLVKPFDAAVIQESTQAALKKSAVFAEIRHLRRRLKERFEFGGMLSKTPEMHRVFEIIRMVAPTDSTVVVEGETGTGKELVASAIHHNSLRREGPYVTINCGGFPETLLESELFGYQRGAFTSADQSRSGKIELANNGTLFLDEIENMPLSMQVKLLLVLNDKKVQRLGSSRWTQVDMRVIAASNVPLKELISQGKMRSDFFYRINVIPIHLVPLRKRSDDIPILVQDFLRNHPVAVNKKISAITPSAMDLLMRHSWPGNIRELQNVLEKAVVLTKNDMLGVDDLALDYDSDPPYTTQAEPSGYRTDFSLNLSDWMRKQEREYLVQKLTIFEGRIDLTAKSCDIDVRTLHRKLQQHGLDKRDFRKKASAHGTSPSLRNGEIS